MRISQKKYSVGNIDNTMAIDRLKLKKLKNTRDLGGIQTADGRIIKEGKLIRSGKLFALPKSTVNKLKAAGVTTIVDLRVSAECADHPDTVMDGIDYEWCPIYTTPVPVGVYESPMRRTMKRESYRLKREFESIDEYMIQFYRSVLNDRESQESIKSFLRILIEEDGCILWHCASGKDRTGIISMLIEALLGVDEQTILDDYMASRKFWRSRYALNRMVLVLLPVSLKFKRILFGFMRTKREYMQNVIDELKLRYGGIVGYCKTVLGVSDTDIRILKDKYLVENDETD